MRNNDGEKWRKKRGRSRHARKKGDKKKPTLIDR